MEEPKDGYEGLGIGNIPGFFVQMKQYVIDANSSIEKMSGEPTPVVNEVNSSQVENMSKANRTRIMELEKGFDEKLREVQFERDNLQREILEMKSKRELAISGDRTKDERIRTLQQQVTSLQKQKEILEAHSASFHAERREFKQRYGTMKNQMDGLVGHIQTFEHTVQLLDSHQRKIHDGCQSLEESLKRMSNSNSHYISQVTQMRKKNASLQTEVIELEYAVKHVTSERDLAKQSEEKSRKNVESFLNDTSKDTEKERDVLNFLQKSTDETTKLEIKIREMVRINMRNKKVHALRLKTLQEKLSNLMNLQFQKQVTSEKNISSLTRSKEEISRRLSELQKELETTTKTTKSQNEKIDNFKMEKEKLGRKVEQLTNSETELNRKIEELQIEMKNSKKRYDDVTSRNEKIVKELETLVMDRKVKEEQIFKLKLLLDEAQQKLLQHKTPEEEEEDSYGRSRSRPPFAHPNFAHPRPPKPPRPPSSIYPKLSISRPPPIPSLQKIPKPPRMKPLVAPKPNFFPPKAKKKKSATSSQSVADFLASLKAPKINLVDRDVDSSPQQKNQGKKNQNLVARPPAPPYRGQGNSMSRPSLSSPNNSSRNHGHGNGNVRKEPSCEICGKSLFGYLVSCCVCKKQFHGHCVGEEFGDYTCDLCSVKERKKNMKNVNKKKKKKTSSLSKLGSASASGTRKRKNRTYGAGPLGISGPKKKKRKILKRLTFTLD